MSALHTQLHEHVQQIAYLKAQVKSAQQQHADKARLLLQHYQQKWATAEALRMQDAHHLAAVQQQLLTEAQMRSEQAQQLQQLQAKLNASHTQTQQDAECIAALRASCALRQRQDQTSRDSC